MIKMKFLLRRVAFGSMIYLLVTLVYAAGFEQAGLSEPFYRALWIVAIPFGIGIAVGKFSSHAKREENAALGRGCPVCHADLEHRSRAD
jgi:hypothetical protein